MEEEIIIYNRLIAEFMGYSLVTPLMRKNPEIWTCSYWENTKLNKNSKRVLCAEKHLKYHSSWDWLMPVRKKIIEMFETEHTLPRFEITSHYVQLYLDNFKCSAGCYLESLEKIKFSSELEALWYVIVEFIKWYNKNTNEIEIEECPNCKETKQKCACMRNI